jgi:hypothetical protein
MAPRSRSWSEWKVFARRHHFLSVGLPFFGVMLSATYALNVFLSDKLKAQDAKFSSKSLREKQREDDLLLQELEVSFFSDSGS